MNNLTFVCVCACVYFIKANEFMTTQTRCFLKKISLVSFLVDIVVTTPYTLLKWGYRRKKEKQEGSNKKKEKKRKKDQQNRAVNCSMYSR